MSVSGGLEYKCFSAAKPFEPRYQRAEYAWTFMKC